MKYSLSFVLFILIAVACEIDDDFGKSTLPDAPGEKLATTTDYVARMLWYDPDKILLHTGYLSVLDVSQGSVEIASEEYFHDVVGVTSTGKAICLFLPNDNNPTLRAIDLEGTDHLTLTQNVYYDYYLKSGMVVAGEHVFYSEVDTNWRLFLYRHNIVTNVRSALLEGGIPMAVSPDGTKLLYSLSNQQTLIYDLEEGVHTNAGVLPVELIRVAWTPSGIQAYSFVTGTNGGMLEVWDLNSGTTIVRHSDVVDRNSVFVSADGERYSYSTARCSNPYYVYNCYDEASQLAILENGTSGGTPREVARHRVASEAFPASLASGAFAPDASALVYSFNNAVYHVSLTD